METICFGLYINLICDIEGIELFCRVSFVFYWIHRGSFFLLAQVLHSFFLYTHVLFNIDRVFSTFLSRTTFIKTLTGNFLKVKNTTEIILDLVIHRGNHSKSGIFMKMK